MRYFPGIIGLCFLAACSVSDPGGGSKSKGEFEVHGTLGLEGEGSAEGIEVTLRGASESQTTTDEKGAFIVKGLSKGHYTLHAAAPSFQPLEEGIDVGFTLEQDIGVRRLSVLRAAINGNALVDDVNAGDKTVSRRGGVSVTIRKTETAHGEPVTASTESSYTTVSGPDGTYQLPEVPAGTYEVTASSPDADPAVIEDVKVDGNGTVTVSDIVLHPLTGFFAIEGTLAGNIPSSRFTQNPLVALTLSGFNADKMKIGILDSPPSEDVGGCVWGAVQTYAAVKSYLLTTEGTNTLCVVYLAADGRATDPLFESIVYDATPPVAPFIEINHGAIFTRSNQLSVALDAVDSLSGVESMQVSADPAFTGAVDQDFVRGLVWPAPAGDGPVTLWARFSNGAGIYSAVVSATIVIDSLAPQISGAGILINGGSAQTNSNLVNLTLLANGASEMMLGNDASFAGSWWEPYRNQTSWSLAPVQGNRSVSVRFRDGAGNESAVATASIGLDTIPPSSPTISINNAGAATHTTSLLLTLSAVGATQMQISNDGIFDAEPWQPYATVVNSWIINPGDGAKSVSVRYADDASNTSAAVSASIILDTAPPLNTSINIDAGAFYSTSHSGTANLTLSALDLATSVSKMKVANLTNGTCANALAGSMEEEFATPRSWLLANPGANVEGTRTVCVGYRDSTGNWAAPVSDSIQYDTLPPQVYGGAIVVNEGEQYSTSTQIQLALLVTGATEMMLGNDGSFAGSSWEPHRSLTAWFLPNVQGLHSVSVMYRDAAGNVAGPFADNIELDSVPPSSPAISISGGAPYATTTTVSLTLSAIGATRMRIDNAGDFSIAPLLAYANAVTGWSLTSGDGGKNVYAVFEDEAGNLSPVALDSIVLDTVPPQNADFTIEEAPLTPLLTVHLDLTATGATEMQIGEDDCGGLWMPYSTQASYNFRSSADGTKVIAVAYRDNAGNQTACIYKTVVLDSTAPHIDSVGPRSGLFGSTVFINGINFGVSQGGSALKFGSVSASITGWSNSEIQALVPDGVGPGFAPITVTIGGTVSNGAIFSVLPTLTSNYPTYGRRAETFTLAGKNFGSTQADGKVFVGGLEASALTWSQNYITAVTPSGGKPGLTSIWMISNGVSTATKPFANIPELFSISPTSGTHGDSIQLQGQDFGEQNLNSRVRIGGIEATISNWTPSQIQADIPNGIILGNTPVQVVSAHVTSNPVLFFNRQPSIDQRYPSTGTVGTQITLVGQRFGTPSGSVSVGGVPASVLQWTDSTVTIRPGVTTPSNSQSIVLTDSLGNISDAKPFNVRPGDSWLTPDAPVAQYAATSVWTGKELIVWGGKITGGGLTNAGGRYNPVTDSWTSIIGFLPSRSGHTAVWTGLEMIVWGGGAFNTGGRYNPNSDSWSATNLINAPVARQLHSAVWTGTDMIIWSGTGAGVSNSGARYNPTIDIWLSNSIIGAPSARNSHTAIWSGAEMIVWGGSGPLGNGGRYNPETDTWSTLSNTNAPIARSNHTALWLGNSMFVWGGVGSGSTRLATGGRYYPSSDTWSTIATAGAPSARDAHSMVSAGGKLAVWGGFSGSVYLNSGGVFDPSTNTWSSTSLTSAPSIRRQHSAIWTGSDMLVWGGYDGISALLGGGKYNLQSGSWSDAWGGHTAPSARTMAVGVWTGSEMVVWGGMDVGGATTTGGRYDPAMDLWKATSTVGVPIGRDNHSAVWTGSKVVVWGGNIPPSGVTNTGGRYSPATDSWQSVNLTGAPSERTGHTAIWTGAEMIIWGGSYMAVYNNGARYNPETDVWTAMAAGSVSRGSHAAVWSGSVMIVWGGYTGSGNTNSGDRYSPGSNTWVDTSITNAPAARSTPVFVWSGTRMIVWGGSAGGTNITTGGMYNPTLNNWIPTSSASAPPTGFRNPSAVWDGIQMIIWGGLPSPGSYQQVGYKLNPSTNTWSTTSTANIAGRESHVAVWTGDSMLIFGGNNASGSYPSTFGLYVP